MAGHGAGWNPHGHVPLGPADQRGAAGAHRLWHTLFSRTVLSFRNNHFVMMKAHLKCSLPHPHCSCSPLVMSHHIGAQGQSTRVCQRLMICTYARTTVNTEPRRVKAATRPYTTRDILYMLPPPCLLFLSFSIICLFFLSVGHIFLGPCASESLKIFSDRAFHPFLTALRIQKNS